MSSMLDSGNGGPGSSRDGRANGREFVVPIIAGLVSAGSRTVYDAGVAATPTTGVLVRQLRAAGGIP